MSENFVYGALLCTLSGCVSPAGQEITVTDDPAAVTDAADDPLFDLAIVEGDAIALIDVQVWLTPPGGTTSVMPWDHDDLDEDGMLSAGDVLHVREPPVDIVGTAQIGTEFEVKVLEDLGDSRVSTLWEGSWTAD